MESGYCVFGKKVNIREIYNSCNEEYLLIRKGLTIMFTKKYEFTVETHQVIDFVRLLGRIGLKFDMSDERCTVDNLDPAKKFRYRTFNVYGKKNEMVKLFDALNIVVTYHKH